MNYEHLNQAPLSLWEAPTYRSSMEIVELYNELFQEIAEIIEITKTELIERIINDPKPELYEDKTLHSTFLNNLIRVNINKAVDKGCIQLIKERYYQCNYYNVNGEFSLYIKKLDKNGRPSYNESVASTNRLLNNESKPCVFIGPRVNEFGIIGNTYISIINGQDVWLKEIMINSSKNHIGIIHNEEIEVSIKENAIIERQEKNKQSNAR